MIRRLFKGLVRRLLFRKLAPANKLENTGNPFTYPASKTSMRFMKDAHDAVISQMLDPTKIKNSQHKPKAFGSSFHDKH